MLQTEYVRNLNSNYARILLDEKPEEHRYQYCILSRGGIKGLLSCDLRYINGQAYLYYDISSRQNVAQLFGRRSIGRDWIKDFLWSVRRLRQELERFLLEDCNILWNPEMIYQDLESNVFSFLYVPYYEGESGFRELMDFWVEHIDYEDEGLVDCVYRMYERLEKNGDAYLKEQIFEDAKVLEQEQTQPRETPTAPVVLQGEQQTELERPTQEEKRGIRHIFDARRKKSASARENYRQEMQRAMAGYAAAEETVYTAEGEETYGRTVYMEEKPEKADQIRRLFTPEDKLVAAIEKPAFFLGKKKGEVDAVLEDLSVSRIHARITREGEDYYLEDLNSTNGTFKNGLRLQPYEKRRLDTGDEIRCGRTMLIFR